jgi:hypothetical protein
MGVCEVEYLYAKQLKKEFNVLAGFYNQNINGGIFRCRSNAYVIRKGTRITEKVDAVLILMNPGTSSPIFHTYFLSRVTRQLTIIRGKS